MMPSVTLDLGRWFTAQHRESNISYKHMVTMQFNSSKRKHGPIEVSETEEHFLVKIHRDDRDRAKNIKGRQYDWSRQVWVFPKSLMIYNLLRTEFIEDADLFEINAPKNTIIPTPSPVENEEEFHNDYFDESEIIEGDEFQSQILTEMEEVRSLIEFLKEHSISAQRSLNDIQQTQQRTDEMLTEAHAKTNASKISRPNEVKAEQLDLSCEVDVDLLEKTLILVAKNVTGQNNFFAEWINKQKPLSQPIDFITSAHELLKEQLEKLLGESAPHDKFITLLRHLKEENMIYSEKTDPVRVLSTLHALNHHRNQIVHGCKDSPEVERRSRSIIYLMNLALIWTRVIVDDEVKNV